jgi:hypothetical protein
MARLGWQAKFGGFIEATLRTLTNESYTAPDYQQAHSLDVRYSRPWQEFYFGAELTAGRTVLGENYSRLGAFIRF